MAWTTPRTWVPGELVTASMMNTHVRDNLNFLFGVIGTSVSKILPYPATIASVGNTTPTNTWSFVLGAAMADKEIIEVRTFVKYKNAKGSSGVVSVKLGLGGVDYNPSSTWANNATESTGFFHFIFVRVGMNAYVHTNGWNYPSLGLAPDELFLSNDLNNGSNAIVLTTPNFAIGQLGRFEITLAATDAAFYYNTAACQVRHYTN